MTFYYNYCQIPTRSVSIILLSLVLQPIKYIIIVYEILKLLLLVKYTRSTTSEVGIFQLKKRTTLCFYYFTRICDFSKIRTPIK